MVHFIFGANNIFGGRSSVMGKPGGAGGAPGAVLTDEAFVGSFGGTGALRGATGRRRATLPTNSVWGTLCAGRGPGGAELFLSLVLSAANLRSDFQSDGQVGPWNPVQGVSSGTKK